MEINKQNKTISMSREFNASLEQVWRAYTEADLIKQWWGPRQYEVIVDKLDFTVDGEWRFVQKAKDGGEHAFHGVFKEIIPNEKIVWTFEYEGMPGQVLIENMLFEKLDENRTKVTSMSNFDTEEDIKGMVESGMEQGANESWDRLGELFGTVS